MASRALYLVCYDVSCNRTRRAVHKVLAGFRVSGQKSAFECLFTAGELQRVIGTVEELIDPDTDRVHVIRLDPRMPRQGWGRARMHELGQPLMVV